MADHESSIVGIRHARTRARSRQAGQSSGSRAAVLLRGEDTGGRFALLELQEARGDGPPFHLHHWEDETIYVLQGELIVYLGDASLPAAAGSALLLPRGVAHSYLVISEAASLLVLFTPSGFEGYFKELAESTLDAPASLERVITVAACHGCEITGPPPRSAVRSPPP